MQLTPTIPALVRVNETCTLTGEKRSTYYAKAANGLMPKPIKIGPRAAAVPASEIAAINAARIRGAGDDEIRALVAELHAQRAGAAA
jgi:prophage regulatory protein